MSSGTPLPTSRAERLVLDLWTRTRMDWGFASERISEAFRRERGLASRERRAVAETLYGMIRNLRRIDYALDVAATAAGGRLPSGHAREHLRYLAYRVLCGELTAKEAASVAPAVLDWEALLAVDERIAAERDEVKRLAIGRSLPDWLARRLQEQYEEEADPLAAALGMRAPLTIRANTLRTTREALCERLQAEGIATRPTRFAVAGLTLEEHANVFATAAFKEGLLEVQDEASQLVAEVVAPPPRGLVVDSCAGAGGKTLALGALLASRGRLIALDVSGRRLEELRRRARRAGLSNVRAVEVERDAWPDEVERLVGLADRVLCDAPCSGVGALRRNPEAKWRLTEADVVRLPAEQESILRRSLRLVAKGGRLIYATCTVLAEENEAVVERVLGSEPGLEPVRVAEIWGSVRAFPLTDPSGTYLKMLPHRHETDGFFAAVLRRKR